MGSFFESSVDQAGDIGGNGISRFHWVPGDGITVDSELVDGVHDAIHQFYSGLALHLPSSMSYAIQPEVKELDAESGKLLGLVAAGATLADIHGLATANTYPAGVGTRVRWLTGQIVFGRRLSGSLFLVPLASNAYTSAGSLDGAIQGAILASADTLVGNLQGLSCSMIVFHRPPKGATTGGVIAVVQAQSVGTAPASLRSRRV
jgi:hypothetical protein